jgi:spore maturation protein SpmA
MLEQINNQRLNQRKILLWFIIILTSLIAIVFAVMLYVNIQFNASEKPPVFSDAVLSTVGVSFFIELIAVIKIVTEKLWDERQFLDSEAFRSTPKDKTTK